MSLNNPKTDAEWQRLVNMTAGLLLIQSMRELGYITGGFGVDKARCEATLKRGAALGFTPEREAEWAAALVESWEKHGPSVLAHMNRN